MTTWLITAVAVAAALVCTLTCVRCMRSMRRGECATTGSSSEIDDLGRELEQLRRESTASAKPADGAPATSQE